jgi:acyl-CoA dehydrogenase
MTQTPQDRAAPCSKMATFIRDSFPSLPAGQGCPATAQVPEKHIVPRELFTKSAEFGFLAMAVDEEYGGSGVDD